MTDHLLRACCECRRRILVVDGKDTPGLMLTLTEYTWASHGYCPRCERKILKEIECRYKTPHA